jgi:hypothetical protein
VTETAPVVEAVLAPEAAPETVEAAPAEAAAPDAVPETDTQA